MSLLARVSSEPRIGALKLLAIEANKTLSQGKQIVGYAKYKLDSIEELRSLIISSLQGEPKPIVKDNEDKLSQINSIDTITGLKEMAKMLGMSGYSKYNTSTKEELRKLIIIYVGGKPPPVKPKLSPVKPKLSPVAPKVLTGPDSNLEMKIRNEKTISGMIRLCATLDIPKLRSYRLADIDTLRHIALQKIMSGVLPVDPGPLAPPNPGIKVAPPGAPVFKLNGCQWSQTDKLTTTPLEDFKNLKFGEHKANDLQTCLRNYGIPNAKKFGAGSYGQTYLVEYMGQSTVFKVVNLEESSLGVEGFKWECVIAERAAKIGVGPAVLVKGICHGSRNTPKFGVLAMGRCSALPTKGISRADFPELMGMIQLLHDNGITHRDLGTRNIMKSGNKYVFIDYGLALAFPGKVPHQLALFDYSYLFADLEGFEWLKGKFSADDFATIKKMDRNPVFAEEVTAHLFPIEMLRTVPFVNANFYFNKIKEEGSPDDRRIGKIVKDRLKPK